MVLAVWWGGGCFCLHRFWCCFNVCGGVQKSKRDLPRGMVYSLVICTIVFIVLALVLTGMMSYSLLKVDDPLVKFLPSGVKWMLLFVSVAATVAMTSVILVFQMGQPRIWMSMSRDGLLPKIAAVHQNIKHRAFATIMTGLAVGIPIFFTTPKFVLDFTSIGTFVCLCALYVECLHCHEEKKRNVKKDGFSCPILTHGILCRGCWYWRLLWYCVLPRISFFPIVYR